MRWTVKGGEMATYSNISPDKRLADPPYRI